MSRPNILALLQAGQAKLEAAHDAEEATKLGTLRGGSVGALIDGKFYGKCPRVAYARSIGISGPMPKHRDLMFAGGRTNEDSWAEVLEASWDGVVLREADVPVAWTTSNGTKVSGRPDIVLADKERKPLLGLELKLVSSFWTMVSILLKRQPKTDHMIQAAHYSMALGVPFELWYTSRVDWPIIGYALKFFEGLYGLVTLLGEEALGSGKKGPNKVFPFYQGFELRWGSGHLCYRCIGAGGDWVTSALTQSSITSFYEHVAGMGTARDLGPRISGSELFPAQAPMGYDPCSPDYCPFSGICDLHETDREAWVKAARKQFGKEGADSV